MAFQSRRKLARPQSGFQVARHSVNSPCAAASKRRKGTVSKSPCSAPTPAARQLVEVLERIPMPRRALRSWGSNPPPAILAIDPATPQAEPLNKAVVAAPPALARRMYSAIRPAASRQQCLDKPPGYAFALSRCGRTCSRSFRSMPSGRTRVPARCPHGPRSEAAQPTRHDALARRSGCRRGFRRVPHNSCRKRCSALPGAFLASTDRSQRERPAALDRRPSGIQRLVVPDLGERHIVGVRLFRSLVCLVRVRVEAF